jgi:hypothetical protein
MRQASFAPAGASPFAVNPPTACAVGCILAPLSRLPHHHTDEDEQAVTTVTSIVVDLPRYDAARREPSVRTRGSPDRLTAFEDGSHRPALVVTNKMLHIFEQERGRTFFLPDTPSSPARMPRQSFLSHCIPLLAQNTRNGAPGRLFVACIWVRRAKSLFRNVLRISLYS